MAVVADVHEDGEVRLASGCSINGALAQVLQKSGAWEKGKICGLVLWVFLDLTGRIDELVRCSECRTHRSIWCCRAAELQCCSAAHRFQQGPRACLESVSR